VAHRGNAVEFARPPETGRRRAAAGHSLGAPGLGLADHPPRCSSAPSVARPLRLHPKHPVGARRDPPRCRGQPTGGALSGVDMVPVRSSIAIQRPTTPSIRGFHASRAAAAMVVKLLARCAGQFDQALRPNRTRAKNGGAADPRLVFSWKSAGRGMGCNRFDSRQWRPRSIHTAPRSIPYHYGPSLARLSPATRSSSRAIPTPGT